MAPPAWPIERARPGPAGRAGRQAGRGPPGRGRRAGEVRPGGAGPPRLASGRAVLTGRGSCGAGRGPPEPRRESRTPAPQTPAFAVPETRMVEGDPGRALEKI